jgi:hypothetical protein
MTSRSDYTRNLAKSFPLTPAPDDTARRASVASGIESMLWYDSRNQSLADKVKRACQAFSEKYGATARTVSVNPAMLVDGAPIEIDGVKVIPDRMVQPQHFNVSAKETR